MLKLDNDLLQQLGLGSLPDDQKRSMLQHIYDTLELRVGTNLANQMSDQQLLEFEQFMDAGGDSDKAQALKWLETNLPHYKDVVNQEFEKLKGEVMQMAPQILAASAPAPVMPAADDGGFVAATPAGVPVAPMGSAPTAMQQPVATVPGYAQPGQQPAAPSYAQPAPQPQYAPSSYGQPTQATVPAPSYVGAGAPQDMTGFQPQAQAAWPPQNATTQPNPMPATDPTQFPSQQQQPPAGPSGYPPQPGYSA